MKSALAGAAILLVGIAVGYKLSPAPQPPAPETTVTPVGESAEARKLRELREKLAAFSEHDLEDYVRLKSLEERYKKADELVGKMILILLADVGLRVSMRQEKFAKAPPATPEPPKSAAAPSPVPTKTLRSPTMRDYAERRLQDRHIGNPERYLRDLKLENFGEALGKSTAFSVLDPSLNGCFDGQTRLLNGRDWSIHLALALELRGGTIVGQSLVELSEDGKTISRAAHDGTQQGIRRLPDSAAILFEASESVYFQLYVLSGGEALAGNIYLKDAPLKYSYKGTTLLTRTQCAK